MSALFILIGISIAVALVFLLLFVLAVKSGQYDDTEGPSIRALSDRTIKKKGRNNEV